MTTGCILEAIKKECAGAEAPLPKAHQEIEIAAGMLVSPRCAAEKRRETDIRDRAQLGDERVEKGPLSLQVESLLDGKFQPLPAGNTTNGASRGRAAERALVCPMGGLRVSSRDEFCPPGAGRAGIR